MVNLGGAQKVDFLSMRRGGGWVLEIEWLDPSALLVNTGVFSGSRAIVGL